MKSVGPHGSSGAETAVGVTLTDVDREITGESRGFTTGSRNTLRLVAEATASAACSTLAPEHGSQWTKSMLENTGDGERG